MLIHRKIHRDVITTVESKSSLVLDRCSEIATI